MNFFSRKPKEPEAPSAEQLNDRKSYHILDSLKNSVAFIEFSPSGNILDANDNFLNVIGYSLEEIKGKHHKIFCNNEYAQSSQYNTFWQQLSSGQAITDRFLRLTKSGEIVWLEASYSPILDDNGKIQSIVKIATDITQHVIKASIQDGLLNALDHSMAIISFKLDGTIIDANENFSHAVGYKLEEIKGKHHKMFCSTEITSNSDYKKFWAKLNSGQFVQGLFERRTSTGDVIWLEASYNPIRNENGELIRIVKFATDVTERVNSIKNASEAVQSTVTETEQVSQHAKIVLTDSINVMHDISVDVEVLAKNIADLTEQSDKISAMVNTISSIADQTNLLALNAAIEAARAGEQGRGFAVVADEVRQLAGRTSTSTTEIANVVKNNHVITSALSKSILSTQEKSKAGTELIAQVDGIFREINMGMQGVTVAVERLV